MSASSLQEKKFLLEDTIQLSILTHAESLKGLTIEQMIDRVTEAESFANKELSPFAWTEERGLPLQDDQVELPTHVRVAWDLLKKNGWSEATFPELNNTTMETIELANLESFFSTAPGVSLMWSVTGEVMKLLEKYGVFKGKEAWIENLRKRDWSGAFALAEPRLGNEWKSPGTVAKKSENGYLINGIKDFVAAAGHDLTACQVHIVKSEIKGSTPAKDTIGLFAVPTHIQKGEEYIPNDCRVISSNLMVGIKDIPFCKMAYGENQNCVGYLLTHSDDPIFEVMEQLRGLRSLLATQHVAQLAEAKEYFIGAIISHTENELVADNSAGLLEYPQVMETLVKSTVYSEGLRNAVLQTAFFSDCAEFGSSGQKQFFEDLRTIYSAILKGYIATVTLNLAGEIESTLGGFGQHQGTLINQISNDARVTSIQGGLNQNVADELVMVLLTKEDGRLFQNLMSHFQSLDINLASSGPVRESIAIWQDFLGGLYVLIDDLLNQYKEGGLDAYRFLSKSIGTIFGEVILCFHLINQAIVAERKMEEGGVNFYNLQGEILNKPELAGWYNKVIQLEYFAAHVLSLKENLFHLIQRKPETVPAFIPVTK